MICRVCDSTSLELALDLGMHPWCNHFLKPEEVGKEPRYPLRLVYCHDCSTVQLDYTVPKEIMFGDHTYLSGITKSLSEHFRQIAQEVNDRFGGSGYSGTTTIPRAALDIGSNDGTQLKHFQALGYDILGVESSRTTARIAADAGIPTVNAFFNDKVAAQLDRQFDVINAAGVFFHLEELHAFTDGVRLCLKPDGVFVIQFLYMKRIVENGAFDQIYHEHLLYYNLDTVQRLLRRHGLEVFDAYVASIHGGSVIAFCSLPGRRTASARLQELLRLESIDRANTLEIYQQFARRVECMKEENLAYLRNARENGKITWGFGAPVKGNTLLNYFGVGPDLIELLVEKNPLRKGLISPGMHIPIALEQELTRLPDVYYVLAWNFKKEILANNQALISRGVEFYFPINPNDD